jgi:4-hydroxy-tetrahydrodipicolinate reductase
MKVILCGACGRMGRNVAALAAEKNVTVVCGVDLFPSPMPFPVYQKFEEIQENADTVIDFSSAKQLKERLEFCAERNLPIVLAATGYTQEDLALIEEYAMKIAIFKTGNLSLGVNLLQLLTKKAAEILGDGFDVEIIERHHNRKKDAPSGTALMLAESVNEGLQSKKRFTYGREGMVGERDRNEICIHAVRGGTIVGEHEVMFAGEDEIITLSHSARSRMVFANGALQAAKWLKDQPAGLYNMDDLFRDIL